MSASLPTAEDVRAIVREEIRAALAELERRRERKPLPVPEAARELGIGERTLRRRIAAGEIPVIRVGRLVRVDMAKVDPPEATVARLAAVGRSR